MLEDYDYAPVVRRINKKGVDGRDGIDGKDGIDGIDGEKGAEGREGKLGPKGDTGSQGETGPQGLTGEGIPGKDGIDGTDGKNGIDGKDGTDSTVPGPKGPIGLKGDKGDKGSAGERGETGSRGVDGTDGLQGSKGNIGDKGDRGSKGEAGTDGAEGKQGEKGDKPKRGVDYVVINGSRGPAGVIDKRTLDTLVPYVGANKDVDLGNYELYSDGIHVDGYTVNPPTGAGLTLAYFSEGGFPGPEAYIGAMDWDTLEPKGIHIEGSSISVDATVDKVYIYGNNGVEIDADGIIELKANTLVSGTLTVEDGLVVQTGYVGSVVVVDDTYNVLTTDYTIVGNKETDFDITLPKGSIGQVFTIKNVGAGNINVKTPITSEPVAPVVLDDGNTVAWFDAQENITKDGSNFVSVWGDKSGLDHHLLQATGTNQPLWSANGVLFDGIDNFMKCVNFPFIQPEFIYMVVRQVTFTSNDGFFDGGNSTTVLITQSGASPIIKAYAGTFSGGSNNLALNTWGIIRFLAAGANSKLIINNTAPITGDFGTKDSGGFLLGMYASTNYGNIEVKEIILRKVADTPADEAAIYAYLAAKMIWVPAYETIDGEYSQAIPQWDAIKVQCYNDNKWIII